MIGTHVQPIAETLCMLTTEKEDAKGQPSDLEGNAVKIEHGREMYIDAFTGSPIVRVTTDEAKKLRADGKAVANGVGTVHGLFIVAPDHTTHGILADKVKKKKAA